MLRSLWLHSQTTAYSNEAIAQKQRIPNSSDSFMIGLLHDIGKLLILHLAEEAREPERALNMGPNLQEQFELSMS